MQICGLSQTLLAFRSCILTTQWRTQSAIIVSVGISQMDNNRVVFIKPKWTAHITVSTCSVTVCYPTFVSDVCSANVDPQISVSRGIPKPLSNAVLLETTPVFQPNDISFRPTALTRCRTVRHMVHVRCISVATGRIADAFSDLDHV